MGGPAVYADAVAGTGLLQQIHLDTARHVAAGTLTVPQTDEELVEEAALRARMTPDQKDAWLASGRPGLVLSGRNKPIATERRLDVTQGGVIRHSSTIFWYEPTSPTVWVRETQRGGKNGNILPLVDVAEQIGPGIAGAINAIGILPRPRS
jgi:hypothetical protein